MNFLNKLIVSFVSILPRWAVFIFAKKYIAGIELEDAINVIKDLNSKGISATLDVLGEAISTKDEAISAKNECLKSLEAIKKENLDSNLSIKPTQFGLEIDEDFAFEQVKEIVLKAKNYNNFVRIDMEDSSTTDKIIRLFSRLRDEFDNIGIVVQAYLRRTMDDVKKLNSEYSHYRLCKGIYIEPEKIAYKGYQEVRDNYMNVLGTIFNDKKYVGIATHDKYLVDESYKMIKERNIAKDQYEFQMLYGVNEPLRDMINNDGHKIRVYVPFGENWHKYSIRRLKENPKLAWYITKSLFGIK